MHTQAPPRTLALVGELDVASVRGLGADLSEAVGDLSRDLVVDLRRVTFIDSSALGALVKAARRLGTQGRTLGLRIAPGGPVEGILDATGLRAVFDVSAA